MICQPARPMEWKSCQSVYGRGTRGNLEHCQIYNTNQQNKSIPKFLSKSVGGRQKHLQYNKIKELATTFLHVLWDILQLSIVLQTIGWLEYTLNILVLTGWVDPTPSGWEKKIYLHRDIHYKDISHFADLYKNRCTGYTAALLIYLFIIYSFFIYLFFFIYLSIYLQPIF